MNLNYLKYWRVIRYFIKSKTKTKHNSPSLNEAIKRHSVVEFDDGWIEFNISQNQFIVHSIYAEGDYKHKFEYIYSMAKALDKEEIIFESQRNPKVWIRMINSIVKKLKSKSKTKVKSHVMCVTLK